MKTEERLKIILSISWRNVWKNKRRTILTLLTITVGAAMIVLMNAFAKGSHDQMIEDAAAANTGHIQIHAKGFRENHSLEYAFRPDDAITGAVRSDTRIKAAAKRIIAAGLISHGKTTSGAIVQGADFRTEPGVSILHTKIRKGGAYLSGDADEIVMGETLAKNLGAGVGSEVSIMSQGFDGSIAAGKFVITGVFRSGSPEYDQGLCLINIDRAAEMFSMMDYLSSIVIRLKNIDDYAAVRDSLRISDAVKEYRSRHSGDDPLEVLAWDELMPEMVQFIAMDDFSGYIFNFILFMVVAFGILNTIQMSVFERIREFGVMLAIGTRPGQIIEMIQLESLFISLLGTAIGCSLGAAMSVYFEINPLNYSEYAKEMEVWGISTIIFPARLTAINITITSALTLAVAQIFTVFPARRAARLKPVEAIRHL